MFGVFLEVHEEERILHDRSGGSDRSVAFEGRLDRIGRFALDAFGKFLFLVSLVVGKTRTGRNQATDDHVFLQAAQFVALAHDGGFRQNARRFLERSGRDEAVRRERGLRDTEEHVVVRRRTLAERDHAIVLVEHFGAFDLFALDEVRVARIGDLNAAQHLTNNHFDVLVVDLHALQTVHVLNFVDDVASELFDTEQTQDVVRIHRTVDHLFALLHDLTVVNENGLVLADERFVRVAFAVGDDETLLALRFLTERDGTRHFGEHAGILRAAGFEEFGHSRETPGNVSGLLRFGRDTREHFAHADFLTVADHHEGAHRQLNRHGVVRTRDLHFVAVFVDEVHQRTENARGARLARLRRGLLRVDDDEARETRHFVDLVHDRDVFDNVLELDATGVFRNDRTRHRVPRRELLAGADFLIRTDEHRGAVRHLVAFAFAAVFGHDHFARAGNDDEFALRGLHVAHGGRVLDRTGRLRFDARGDGGTRRGTTDVERTHRKLGTRFADRLSGDDAHGFARVDDRAATEVATVALRAKAVTRFAGERRADLDHVDAELVDEIAQIFVDEGAGGDGDFVRVGVDDVDRRHATEHAVAQRLDDFTAFDERAHFNAVRRVAIVLDHHEVLRHVDETTRQVTRVRGLQSRVGQTLTSTVGRDEVLQNVQTFAEVRGNRRFDNRAVRLGHQAAHAGELTDLSRGASSPGVGHHVDAVEGLLTNLLTVTVDGGFGREFLHHHLADLVGGAAPDVDHLVVAFALRDETRGVLRLDFLHFLFGRTDELLLLSGDGHVAHADRDAGARREAVAVVLQTVREDHRGVETALAEATVDELGDFLLLQGEVELLEAHALRKDFGKERATDGRFVTNDLRRQFARLLVEVVFADANRTTRLQIDDVVVPGTLNFGDVGEVHAFALAVDAFARGVVETEHHVLRRNDRRVAVRREEHVVRRHHQAARFELSFERERDVNGHLVAVEVGVERRANERMELNGLAFDELRFERLNTETVQRRSTVKHHGVLEDDFFEDVPDDRFLVFHHLLGGLRRGRETAQHELVEDEGLEEFKRHQLRQTALVQTKFRTDGNNGTTRVVDALTEQVLTEATRLALDHVGERLERTLVGARHRLAATTVVEERVHRFLQHALFVAHDDVRRLDFEKALETIVAVDDATVEVVQVRRGEAAAVERHERTQVGREHRQNRQDHPLGTDARVLEAFEDLEALGVLLDLRFGVGRAEFFAQTVDFAVDIDRTEKFADGFGTHHGLEVVAEFGRGLDELFFVEQLTAFERREARIDNDIGFEVQNAFDVAQRNVEHHAHTARQALQEPDVRDRARQVDVTHAFATHLGERDFNAALLADDAAILEALVLAANALVVLRRAEDLGAEKTVAFRLLGTVVDRFRLLDFTVRPRMDLLGTRKTNADRIEMLVLLDLVENVVKRCFHRLSFLISSSRGRCRYPTTGFP